MGAGALAVIRTKRNAWTLTESYLENNSYQKYSRYRGFPGGSVIKNLPASAEDMGFIPDPRSPHMLRNN